jgi:hypothetical protein
MPDLRGTTLLIHEVPRRRRNQWQYLPVLNGTGESDRRVHVGVVTGQSIKGCSAMEIFNPADLLHW